ncbi:outer membrane lipoprotein carrier protein LolA [Streptomyces sp. SID9124]|uniref:LolA family protein n=1 Tax=Streptomyces sp. SID9124 TaxID=2706108 RepID=UPI0013DFD876|nr:outer membrane lipoprotein carrier protein LolA [Streptomyces sp. SID9124]NED11554.1 outer membrane lipoprotein carrier protein LolA [Streptomyces sp. SID9124]
MAPNDSAETNGTAARPGRRKAARYIVPVAVAGVAAATIGLVPALASSGDPDLPKITAQELIEKIAASDTERFSGTVKISTDLGIPSVGGLAGSFLSGAAGSGDGGKDTSSADPQAKLTELASGTHTLRVAADGPDKQRLSVLDDTSEYSLIHNGDQVWAYDSGSNAVYHADGEGKAPHGKEQAAPEGVPATPKALAEQALKAADGTTSVTVDGTARIAGRDAYRLVLKPEQKGSTVGSVTVAVDAENGVPLKFTLQPSSGGKAVVDAGFTSVDFGKPAASSFAFTPPKGAKVTEADDAKAEGHGKPRGDLRKFEDAEGAGAPKIIGKGWNSIAEIKAPGGAALPSEASKAKGVPAGAQQFLDALGDKVTGKFGSGTVFKTRLINALMTDDGRVYVGAVTKDALVAAANAG